jgi:hypothetical protein
MGPITAMQAQLPVNVAWITPTPPPMHVAHVGGFRLAAPIAVPHSAVAIAIQTVGIGKCPRTSHEAFAPLSVCVVGAKWAKSTVVAQVNLNLPLGRPTFTRTETIEPATWTLIHDQFRRSQGRCFEDSGLVGFCRMHSPYRRRARLHSTRRCIRCIS